MIAGSTIRTFLRGPFGGLVLDAPPELAHTLVSGQRPPFVVADNVRCKYRQVELRPGVQQVGVVEDPALPLGGAPLVFLWRSQQVRANGERPLVAGTFRHLFRCSFASGDTGNLLTLTRLWQGSSGLGENRWWLADFIGWVIACHPDEGLLWFSVEGFDEAVPVPGLLADERYWDGVTVVWDHLVLWRGEKVRWCALQDPTLWIPLREAGAPFRAHVAGVYTHPSPGGQVLVMVDGDAEDAGVVANQLVRIWVDGEEWGKRIGYYWVADVSGNTLVLESIDTSYSPGAGEVIGSGVVLETVTESDAGEALLTGATFAGPVKAVVAAGQYAYVFKDRSVMSVQFTGDAAAPFVFNRELADEGLLAPKAYLPLGDGSILFLGQRGFYVYKGGQALQPVLETVSRTLYEDTDYSRLDRISLVNYDTARELWLSLPLKSGHVVVSWQYEEQTITLYRFPFTGAVTSALTVEWVAGDIWAELPVTMAWNTVGDTFSWADFDESRQPATPMFVTSDGQVYLFGGSYTDAGAELSGIVETQDLDLGDEARWKYISAVTVTYRAVVDGPDPTAGIEVYVGTKDAAGADISWRQVGVLAPSTGPAFQTWWGNAGGAGRYVRVRLRSRGRCRWQVSGIGIYARPGNVY